MTAMARVGRRCVRAGLAATLLVAAPVAMAQTAPGRADIDRAQRVLARAPVIDGHNDLVWEIRKLHDGNLDAAVRNGADQPYPLQTDLARLKAGRVGGQFWSVWIPADTTGPRAVEMTLEQIDLVRRLVAAHPEQLALAATAADVRRIAKSGRTASLIGVEGGHQIDGRLSVLRQYHALGAAYMTLTQGRSLDWADSSTDDPVSGGLSPFGRQVVAEMNRIGMIVDVSHVSDDTMRAVLATSKAPVMASHSSARALADAPRNIPDDLLRAIAVNGGVVMTNFYPAFLSADWRRWDRERTDYAKSMGVPADTYGARSPAPLLDWERTHPMPRVTIATVADHIDHIAKVAGYDHVGLGGDFDGISGTAPEGMNGVDAYPKIVAELARRGWSDDHLAQLTSGNILRVMEAVEKTAAAMAALPAGDAIDRASR